MECRGQECPLNLAMNKKLGILLSTPPADKNLETVLGLISAALRNNVSVYLSPDEEDLEDMDIIEKFLPIIKDWEIPLYVERDSSAGIDLKKSPYDFRTVDNEEVAEILAGGHSVFVF